MLKRESEGCKMGISIVNCLKLLMLILMKLINGTYLFHRICVQKILNSPKLAQVFVGRKLQIFYTYGTVSSRSSN